MKDRESIAEEPYLIKDDEARAKKESENTLAQLDWAMMHVHDWIEQEKYQLKPSTLLTLNRLALDAVHRYAGLYRNVEIGISGSDHRPIDDVHVPYEIEQMLDYLSDNWERETPIHLAAYAMWRVNWIHPFFDGNGRTARIFSYMVLCAKMGLVPAKGNAIPEQISANKQPYYKALEHADTHCKEGQVDVSQMEDLLAGCLAEQLVGMHQQATGKK